MLRFLFIVLMIYLFFRLGKILLNWYLRNKLNTINREKVRPPSDKFKDATDAEFTDIIDPEKKKNKNNGQG